jgi:hypothetical protein
MAELIALIARTTGTVIEGMAVLIVAFGSVDAFGRLMWVIVSPGADAAAEERGLPKPAEL